MADDGKVFKTESECLEHEAAEYVDVLCKRIFPVGYTNRGEMRSPFSTWFRSLIEDGTLSKSSLWLNRKDFILLGDILKEIPGDLERFRDLVLSDPVGEGYSTSDVDEDNSEAIADLMESRDPFEGSPD